MAVFGGANRDMESRSKIQKNGSSKECSLVKEWCCIDGLQVVVLNRENCETF